MLGRGRDPQLHDSNYPSWLRKAACKKEREAFLVAERLKRRGLGGAGGQSTM
jgi:hypothetical protein